MALWTSAVIFLFQSTLPRRERLKIRFLVSHLEIYFNPRSREGSDLTLKFIASGYDLFQSTLPRRERHDSKRFIGYVIDFNPRSREGSDTILNVLSVM